MVEGRLQLVIAGAVGVFQLEIQKANSFADGDYHYLKITLNAEVSFLKKNILKLNLLLVVCTCKFVALIGTWLHSVNYTCSLLY